MESKSSASHAAESRSKSTELSREVASRTPVTVARGAAPFGKLQRSAGNCVVARLLRSHAIQRKLTVSHPDDEYEREADRVADQVMRMPDPSPVQIHRMPVIVQRMCSECEEVHRSLAPAESSSALINRKCAACEQASHEHHDDSSEANVQTKRASHDPADVSPGLSSYVDSSRSGGDLLPEVTRAYFEPRFGADLGGVRVHSDGAAASAARDIDALAFATGSHIYFGSGQYQPGSASGDRLLAHELTHVVQQGGASQSEPVLARVASVTCTTGRHGAPANAEALIQTAEFFAGLAIATANMDLSLLRMDIVMPGLGAGGGYTMPTGPRLTNYQNSWGLPPAIRGGQFRDRLGRRTYSSQAEALLNEIDTLKDRYSLLSDRILDSSIRFRCIGGPTTIGNCQGHCNNRVATACTGDNRIMLCPNFWTMGMNARGMLLIHEVAHLQFNIDHGRDFSHADCYANYAGSSGPRPWHGVPACVP